MGQSTPQQIEQAVTFISYAREDQEFVFTLCEALKTRNVEPVGDWLLTPGQKYENRLRELNLIAQAFVFVISPDSIKSAACLNELATAVENKKQILPVSRRDHGDDNQLDSALRAPHWTRLREEDDFETGIKGLVNAVNTDFEMMQTHGRLLLAADNWNNNGRNRSYLLRKDGLKEAEAWLAQTSAQPGKLPQPTPLQGEFIFSGRRARGRASRIAFGVVLAIAISLTALTIFAFAQRSQAKTQAQIATANEAKAVSNAQEAQRQRLAADANAAEAMRQQKIAEVNLAEAERQRAIAKANEEQAIRNAAEARRQQLAAEENARRAIEVGKRRLVVATLLLNPEGYKFNSVAAHGRDFEFGIKPWGLMDSGLKNILQRFQVEEHETFVRIFGSGDATVAQRLVDYVTQPSVPLAFVSDQRTDDKDDNSTWDNNVPQPQANSPEGNLNREPWIGRFKQAGEEPAFQALQLNEYADEHLKFMTELQAFAPEIRSERGVAFMLDVALHHNTKNAKNFFLEAKAAGPWQNEAELLQRVAQLSVERYSKRMPSVASGISRRRQMFLKTPFLSNKVLGF